MMKSTISLTNVNYFNGGGAFALLPDQEGYMETIFVILAFIGMFGCGFFLCLLLMCIYAMRKK